MWKELKRPATAVSMVLFLLSVIAGVGTSLYFYKKGQRIAQLSYLIEQVQVVDRTRGDKLPISVLDSSGAPVEGNVFAANIRIWNSGTAEIRRADVRDPLTIILSLDSRLLDLTPDTFTRNNVDKFAVDHVGIISWEHFDPNEGLRMNVVYANPRKGPIKLAGYIVGLEGAVDYANLQLTTVQYSKSALIAIPLCVAIMFFSIPVQILIKVIRGQHVFTRWSVFINLAGLVLGTAPFVLWYYYPPQPPQPPI